MVLFSASLPLKLVEAMAISSPATQSTGTERVMEVAPGSEVVFMVVQVGTLTGPCISRIPFVKPMHLLPNNGR